MMRLLQYWGLYSRRGARRPNHRPANTGEAPQQHQLSPAEPSKHSNCHERTEKPRLSDAPRTRSTLPTAPGPSQRGKLQRKHTALGSGKVRQQRWQVS